MAGHARALVAVALGATLMGQARAQVTACPANWTAAGGACFRVYSDWVNYAGAVAKCAETENATLAKFQSEAEVAAVGGMITAQVWIGASDAAEHGTWVWTDGTSCDLSWCDALANAGADYDYAIMGAQGVMVAKRSGHTGPVACSIPLLTTTTTPGPSTNPPTVESCPADWTAAGGGCFRVYSEWVNYAGALAKCAETENAALAKVQSQEEVSGLGALVTAQVWIGANDLETDGTWVWLDGTPCDVSFCDALANAGDGFNFAIMGARGIMVPKRSGHVGPPACYIPLLTTTTTGVAGSVDGLADGAPAASSPMAWTALLLGLVGYMQHL